MAKSEKGLNVKIGDEELKGRYTNLLRVTHTREEFILDFLNAVPPQAIATARIITSPGHMKRIVRALAENVERYEKAYGVIEEAPSPVKAEDIN
ncbi:MAG: DUF3467 domain-containing protein [Acidobacteriota bacterium]|nr:DUF3467 domain-containing protein [Acidobacteriota bacterium]